MTTLKPYSVTALALGAGILACLGMYFAFLRPPLLPEDLRALGASLAQIETAVPGLSLWLRRVFRVMGGYMFAAGVLTLYVAMTAFRRRERNALLVAGAAGACSIGLMVVINFLINSDFKWLLLILSLPWALAIILYCFEGGGSHNDEMLSTSQLRDWAEA